MSETETDPMLKKYGIGDEGSLGEEAIFEWLNDASRGSKLRSLHELCKLASGYGPDEFPDMDFREGDTPARLAQAYSWRGIYPAAVEIDRSQILYLIDRDQFADWLANDDKVRKYAAVKRFLSAHARFKKTSRDTLLSKPVSNAVKFNALWDELRKLNPNHPIKAVGDLLKAQSGQVPWYLLNRHGEPYSDAMTLTAQLHRWLREKKHS